MFLYSSTSFPFGGTALERRRRANIQPSTVIKYLNWKKPTLIIIIYFVALEEFSCESRCHDQETIFFTRKRRVCLSHISRRCVLCETRLCSAATAQTLLLLLPYYSYYTWDRRHSLHTFSFLISDQKKSNFQNDIHCSEGWNRRPS